MMMEKLGAPQTHLGLKAMIKEVDEDDDNRISFREVSEAMVHVLHGGHIPPSLVLTVHKTLVYFSF